MIDRYTGRPRPDSRYQEGLQQALEAKEGVTVNHDGEVQAQISVQGFAGQYQRLAGMTGTARSAADEFRQKYALDVTVIPTTRPLLRRDFSGRIYATQSEKLAAIAEEVTFCQRVGRPVLVGTWTVEQSAENEPIAHRSWGDPSPAKRRDLPRRSSDRQGGWGFSAL